MNKIISKKKREEEENPKNKTLLPVDIITLFRNK